ncbi:MAG: hypothetical protein ABIU95_15310, partial [Burkholderiales bacterium]
PQEARSVLDGQRRSFEERNVSAIRAAVIASNDDRVLVELHWLDPTGSADNPEQLWQLLTVRGGSIVAMQDFGNRSRALKAM